MAEERARKAAKGWVTRAGKKLQDLLAVTTDGRDSEWRADAQNAVSEFNKRLDVFDAAQTAGITRIAIAGLQNPDCIPFGWIAPGFEIHLKK